MVEIGRKIASLRNDAGKTQQELADFLGVDVKKIGRIERGETKTIKNNDLQSIAIFLNTPISDLLETKMSVSQDKNVSKSSVSCVSKSSVSDSLVQENDSLVIRNYDSPHQPYKVPKLNIKASAGGGNELLGLEHYNSNEIMYIDRGFLRCKNPSNPRVMQVEGHSMIPMLMPDSWVLFEEDSTWQSDGLYVLNYDNQLMVKLLQKQPNGDIDIISVNKEYKSYTITQESQTYVRIIGKVLRCII